MTGMRRLKARVHGRVQGVFYRDSARRVAHDLRLTGFVRNLPDTTVEIVAEGPADDLKRLVEWARQGPPSARVDRVDEQYGEATGEFAIFQIRF